MRQLAKLPGVNSIMKLNTHSNMAKIIIIKKESAEINVSISYQNVHLRVLHISDFWNISFNQSFFLILENQQD